MTLRVRCSVPFQRLNMPPMLAGFDAHNPSLGRFLPRRPRDVGELLESARARIDGGPHDAARAQMAESLLRYAATAGAPAAVLEAAQALAEPGTMAIVTGQQPGLFGGPLYVWHKVATALRLAREVRAHPGAPRVVVVFWNHTDDHDWGEANHTYLVNAALDLQRIRVRTGTTGCALSRMHVGDDVMGVIEEARDLLPATAETERELDRLRPRSGDATLGTLLSRLLFDSFGDEGLLVLDPAALSSEQRAPLLEWHTRAADLRVAMKTAAAELAARGFDVAIDPEGAFMFRIEPDGKRRAAPDGEVCPSGDTPSPGVLLRSVWQDAILPTLAYVPGPGEVAYLALLGSFYEMLGVPRPPLVPRASITHVAPRLFEHLERWQLALPDLEPGAKAVEARIALQEGVDEAEAEAEGPEQQLVALAEDIRVQLRALEPSVAEVDQRLIHQLVRISSRTTSELGRFVRKLENQRRNQAGRYRQHARRLCAELMPRGRMQERVLPALPFLVREGEGFARSLIDVADPFAREHLLVGPCEPSA